MTASSPPSSDRTAAIADFLDQEHFRFRRRPGAEPGAVEIVLTPEWHCRLEAPGTDLTTRMIGDFTRFCRECMDVALRTEAAGPAVVWKLRPDALPAEDFSRQDPETESYEIRVEAAQVEVSARHERGLL
ncbi:MAG TPA: hypothetical protein PLS03_18225, partial [Terrimicrobiaceae bacterium]|nr:hypothetical protein [Terrimicrobiaceae bacterium]